MRTVSGKVAPEDIKITPPHISPETMKAMWEFFLKTSVPRILESRRLERGQAQ